MTFFMMSGNYTGTNTIRGWVSGSESRGTFDIIHSCVTTVFLCCWTSVCVNVPAVTDSYFDHFRDKLNLAALGILSPDYLFTLALGQRDRAWRSVKLFHEAGYTSWTMTHAFFVNMGGYVLETPGYPRFPIDSDQLLYLISRSYLEYPNIEEEDIKDKSKADGLAR
jgi:hypothetical protein